MKKASVFLWIAAVLIVFLLPLREVKASDENSIVALLVVRVISFARWPISEYSSEISLCVLGDDALYDAFLRHEGESFSGKKLNVMFLRNSARASQCSAVFLSEVVRTDLAASVLNDISDKAVLTFGDYPDIKKSGVMVNFLRSKSNQFKLQVNIELLKESGVLLSTRVLRLAEIVDS